MEMNTGLDPVARKKVADGVMLVLANVYTLYLKTQNFHWNVVGQMYQPLHGMFGGQYEALAGEVDELAERIRALGSPVVATYKNFAALSTIVVDETIPTAQEMLQMLLMGHETVVRHMRALFDMAARARDQSTCEMLSRMMTAHEKTAMMLRSFLEPSPPVAMV